DAAEIGDRQGAMAVVAGEGVREGLRVVAPTPTLPHLRWGRERAFIVTAIFRHSFPATSSWGKTLPKSATGKVQWRLSQGKEFAKV
ncbi:MAG: hypothetical protein K2X67_21910, partial [Burkholderiales bacterium]|nr:hypothetical protein [Burkholderiales bacterium]